MVLKHPFHFKERTRDSAGEDRPEFLVAPHLVQEHEFSDRFWELFSLPLAFALACRHRVGCRRRQTHGFDGVGRSTQFMVRHVRGHDCMACRAGMVRLLVV